MTAQQHEPATVYGIPIIGTIETPADILPLVLRAIAERAGLAEHEFTNARITTDAAGPVAQHTHTPRH